ncbi:MAG: HEAT repeat domain-containing protein [Desulfomonilia bacterium]
MDFSVIDAKMASHDPSLRREAALTLARHGGENAIDRLCVLLEDSNTGVRDAAQNGLTVLGGSYCVEKLAALLPREEVSIRNSAIDILRKIGDDGLDILHALASHHSDNVRLFVCDILGSISNPESIDILVEALADPNPNVRNAAVISLGMIGHPRSFSAVRNMMNDEEWIRFSVIEALARIPHDGVADFLLDEIEKRSGDDVTTMALLDAMGKVRSPKTAPVLVDMLEDAPEHLAASIVSTVLSILSPRDVKVLSDPHKALIKSFVEKLLADSGSETMASMLNALSVIGDDESIRVLIDLASKTDRDAQAEQWDAIRRTLIALNNPSLMVELLNGEESLQILASEVLACIGGQEEARCLAHEVLSAQGYVKRAMTEALAHSADAALKPVFMNLVHDPDGHVISLSLQALGRLGTPEDIELITPLINHRYPDVQAAALEVIAQIGSPVAEETFMFLIRVKDPGNPVKGLRGLERMRSPRLQEAAEYLSHDHDPKTRLASATAIRDNSLDVRDDLVVIFLGDETDEIRYVALDIIGRRKLHALRSYLDDAIGSRDMWAASHALEALGEFRDDDAKESLLKILSEGSDFLRISAAKTLGTWGDPSLAEELELYADDENLDVARAVTDALDRLQGVSF